MVMKQVVFLVVFFALVAMISSAVAAEMNTTNIAAVSPNPPVPTSPGSSSAPGSTITTLTPTLQWQASAGGADYYALSISKYPYGFSNVVVNQNNIYGTSWTVPSGVLVSGEKYRWNMQAVKSGQTSSVSSTLYFQTVAAAPNPPVPTSPGSSSEPGPTITTLTPTLQWQASAGGADYYALSISKYPYSPSNVVVNQNNIYGTSWTVPSGVLVSGEKYRWNMQAVKSGQESAVSATLYFQTNTPVPNPPANIPTLVAPINGKYVIPTEAQFQWRKYENTEKYALFIRDLETNQLVFDSLAGNQYFTGSGNELVSIDSPIDLIANHRYRWNIWAITSDGGHTASESFDFNVVSSYPTGRPLDVLSPVEGPLMVKKSIELFGDTERWRFNQHNTGGHVLGGGIGGSDDTYAWDVNLHKSGDTDADDGKPVYAVTSGIVADRYGVYNGQPVDGSPGTYGKVIIEHEYGGNKWYSAYLHLDNIRVEPGDEVTSSTHLGDISSTGTDNNHLHLVFYTGDNTLRGGLTSFDAHIVDRGSDSPPTPISPIIETLAIDDSDVSATSAVLRGRLSNTVSGTEYTVWFKYDKESAPSEDLYSPSQSVSGDGTFEITVTGLFPATTYNYRAIIAYPTTIEASNYKSFTTKASGNSRPLGIDVSRWQKDINWNSVHNSGYSFAFVKATEGDGQTDSKFITNMNGAATNGILVGAYHFARPDLGNSAIDEANYFVEVAGDYISQGYLRPVLDLECDTSLGKEYLSEWVKTWISTVSTKTGVFPIIYVNSNYATNYLNQDISRNDLWIAHWTDDPNLNPNIGIWTNWAFWQYSDKGQVSGIEGDVDLDVFNGDLLSLQNYVITLTPITSPLVSTSSTTSVNSSSATLNGYLSSMGGASSCTVYFQYGTTTSYGSTIGTQTKSSTGTFSQSLMSLSPGTTYHYRAVASNSAGTVYGADTTFTLSSPVTSPSVSTSSATSIGPSSATLNGYLSSMGEASSCTVYFQYGTTTSYGSTTGTQAKSSTGTFSQSLTGLSPGTTYHYRAVASNSAGTAYGADTTFTTSSSTVPADAILYVTNVSGVAPESSATVSIYLNNSFDPKAGAAQFKLYYNESVILAESVSVSTGGVMPQNLKSPITFAFATTSGIPTGDAWLADIIFKVLSTDGSSSELGLTLEELNDVAIPPKNLLSSCTVANGTFGTGGGVRVNILDRSGNPISADQILFGTNQVLNAEAAWFNSISEGTYPLNVSKEGYISVTADIEYTSGTSREFAVVLLEHILQPTIVLSETGTALLKIEHTHPEQFNALRNEVEIYNLTLQGGGAIVIALEYPMRYRLNEPAVTSEVPWTTEVRNGTFIFNDAAYSQTNATLFVTSYLPKGGQTASIQLEGGKLGDVYYDHKITATDALYILHYNVGNLQSLDTYDYVDVYRDGKITATDALYIQHYLVGNLNEFYELP